MTRNKRIARDVRRDTKKVENAVKRKLAAAERRSTQRTEAKRDAGYTATLLDPDGVPGVRIPDDDVRPSFPMHSRAIWTLGGQVADFHDPLTNTTNGVGCAALISPSPADSFITPYYISDSFGAAPNGPPVGSKAWPIFTNWWKTYSLLDVAACGTNGTNMFVKSMPSAAGSSSSWMETSVFQALQGVGNAVRIVSAQLRVDYIGPALSAQGNYILTYVDPTQEIEHNTHLNIDIGGPANKLTFTSGVTDMLSGFLGASQLPEATAYPAPASSECLWVPTDDSTHLYYELDKFAQRWQYAPAGFDFSDDSAVNAVNPGDHYLDRNAYGLELGVPKVGYWLFIAQGLDPGALAQPVFQFTIDVNYEVLPRNNQINMGAAIEPFSTRALEMATNHTAITPKSLLKTTNKGEEITDDRHPTKVIESAKQEVAADLAGAAGTPRESNVTSGSSFLNKIKDVAGEVMPVISEIAPIAEALL